MNKLLRKLEGPVRLAFERAIRRAKQRAPLAAIGTAVRRGDEDAIIAALGVADGMWSVLAEQLRTAYLEAGLLVMASDLPRRLSLDFNINNPRAEAWLRANSSDLVTRINADQREAIREVLRAGMLKGNNPRTVALDIVGRVGPTGRRTGGVVGLNRQQAQYALNMADDLVELNPRYFDRKLRDRRYDSIVQKAIDNGKPLPQKTRTSLVERYEDRLLKHRGDTIARTETLKAINAASDEALNQAIEEGLAPKEAVTRIWRHSYSRNERPGHVLMDGQRRAPGEEFINPLTGAALLHPGYGGDASEVVNCRCHIEHEIDFAAVEKAA